MKINRVEIENFLSVQKATIDFDKLSNLVLVKGRNKDVKPESSNGAGKSTIIEAVVFALFGKTLRKTSAKSLKNFNTKGKCSVKLTINDNIVIERVKSPPQLKLHINGVTEIQDSIASTQKRLESLLNTNINIFLASMVFGQENSMSFLTATPEEKRDILQSFLNMQELFAHRTAIKKLKSQYTADKKVKTALLSETNARITEISDKLKTLRKYREDYNKLMTKDQKSFLRKHSMSEIRELEKVKTQKEQQLHKLELDLQSLNKEIVFNKARIDALEDFKCEHCGKQSSDTELTISNLFNAVKENSEKKKKLSKDIESLKKKIDDISIPISDRELDVAEQIKDSSNKISLLNDDKKSKKKDALKYGKDLADHNKDYEIMRFWEQAFSESGMVKFVIQNILSFFNDRANFYLSTITKGVFTVEFNETLEEQLYNNGTECFFDSLSGGEKKRISLAVTLALNDLLVLSGKERSNLIFFDEVADSLDEVGMKGLHELIEEITKEKKLFLITHDEYLLSLVEDDAEVLDVIKKNKITSYSRR